jgi:hypothetical protein
MTPLKYHQPVISSSARDGGGATSRRHRVRLNGAAETRNGMRNEIRASIAATSKAIGLAVRAQALAISRRRQRRWRAPARSLVISLA